MFKVKVICNTCGAVTNVRKDRDEKALKFIAMGMGVGAETRFDKCKKHPHSKVSCPDNPYQEVLENCNG